MAEAFGKGLQELKDEITCPVCQDLFQEPKILPCFHYYCKQCVLQLAAREQPFPCPECRGDTLLPLQGGADGFPTAFFVNRMKSLYGVMEKVQASEHGDVICGQCQSNNAVAFCQHCAQYICDFCRESHRRMKTFSGHNVVSMEELKRNTVENLPIIVQPEASWCREHQEQLLKIYCFQCNQLICRDCTVIDHKDHRIQFVSKCAPEIKQDLQDRLGPLQSIKSEIQAARKHLEHSESDITAKKTYLRNEIDCSFNEIIKVIEECRDELLTTVCERADEKLLPLADQKKHLDEYTSQIQSLVDFVDQSTKGGSDEEIVSVHKQLQHKIEDEIEKFKSVDLTPVEVPNIYVQVLCTAAEIGNLCRKKTSVVVTERLKCTAEGAGTERAETNMPANLTIHMQDHEPHVSIKAVLRSSVDGSVVHANVSEGDGENYLVSYCPKMRGRHKLSISVNQQPIVGSPFNVFVDHPPNQLGNPVQIIDGIDNPWSIAISKSGHLLVALYNSSCVVALNKDYGKVVPGGTKVLHPVGIDVDEDGSILVASLASAQLMKFNEDWTLAKVVGRKGDQPGQFDNIKRVKISPTSHQYYVCDSGNNRIQVFNRDLEYVLSFGKKGSKLGQLSWPTDLAFDQVGNVFVVEFSNCRIQKFSPVGKPIAIFDNLNGPLCIHISGKFLYITEGHRISVLTTTNGKRVTSFGSVEELDIPKGITTDADGFIYVCNMRKNQIVVY